MAETRRDNLIYALAIADPRLVARVGEEEQVREEFDEDAAPQEIDELPPERRLEELEVPGDPVRKATVSPTPSSKWTPCQDSLLSMPSARSENGGGALSASPATARAPSHRSEDRDAK